MFQERSATSQITCKTVFFLHEPSAPVPTHTIRPGMAGVHQNARVYTGTRDYAVRLAGIDHVGLAGDYDGTLVRFFCCSRRRTRYSSVARAVVSQLQTLPVGLEDVSGYPRLTAEVRVQHAWAEHFSCLLSRVLATSPR